MTAHAWRPQRRRGRSDATATESTTRREGRWRSAGPTSTIPTPKTAARSLCRSAGRGRGRKHEDRSGTPARYRRSSSARSGQDRRPASLRRRECLYQPVEVLLPLVERAHQDALVPAHAVLSARGLRRWRCLRGRGPWAPATGRATAETSWSAAVITGGSTFLLCSRVVLAARPSSAVGTACGRVGAVSPSAGSRLSVVRQMRDGDPQGPLAARIAEDFSVRRWQCMCLFPGAPRSLGRWPRLARPLARGSAPHHPRLPRAVRRMTVPSRRARA